MKIKCLFDNLSDSPFLLKQCTAQCPMGTYSRLPRQSTLASCLTCLAGYYMYDCNIQYSDGSFVPPRSDIHVT